MNTQQITNTILMVRPENFIRNNSAVNTQVQQEFDSFVELLKKAGVQVLVVQDTHDINSSDVLFPSNLISFHENGLVALYPLHAKIRRLERQEAIIDLVEEEGFVVENIMDYTSAEDAAFFLEGARSLVLDRIHKKAYCALSDRSDEDLFIEFCEDFEYSPVLFTANLTIDDLIQPINHTNIMMCIGETFAVLCLECINDKKERKNVIKHFMSDGKDIIDITASQVTNFAGNMLQVIGANNTHFLVMSQLAYNSLTHQQIKTLKQHTQIITAPLKAIQSYGGGSVRCMMVEVF